MYLLCLPSLPPELHYRKSKQYRKEIPSPDFPLNEATGTFRCDPAAKPVFQLPVSSVASLSALLFFVPLTIVKHEYLPSQLFDYLDTITGNLHS